MITVISFLWPVAMIVVAWFIFRRILVRPAPGGRGAVRPDVRLIIAAPRVFAWYTAVASAALTQVPRNRMTRWLAIVTVFLALCHSSGGQAGL